MYRNGSDLQKAETCHMVMWFGGVGVGLVVGAWSKKEQKLQRASRKKCQNQRK